jgi:hypothetical protein
VIGDAARDATAARTQWDQWQGRYERSSRRRARHARIATALIFAAIIANLVLQLVARRI